MWFYYKLCLLFCSKKSTLPPEILAKLPKSQQAQVNPLNGQPFSVKYFDILKKRLTLPVWEYKDSFMATLDKHQTTVLVGLYSRFFYIS